MAFSFDDDYSSPSHASDEISLFLRQLLHRSSSSPSSSSPALQASSLPSTLEHSGNHNVGFSSSSAATPDTAGVLDGYLRLPDRPVVDRASSFWRGIPAGVCSNLPSSSAAAVESDSLTAGTFQLRSAENEADDYDCESEEGPEEAHPKQTSLRNSSKRSRAAEVHNLSEKRRRSRINEKMKALQNLIPNRNKTDKASMLDEAIEYLKQLQLQVQMLSMRNGLILHPMCLPGFSEVVDRDQLFQMGLNLSDKDGSSHPNIIGNTLPSVPLNQCDASTRPRFDSLPGIVTKEVPFSLQSSMANQLGSFKLLTSSQNICRKDTMAQHQLAIMDPQANALELLAPILTSTSKFHSQPLYLKDDLQGIVQINSTSHTQLISSSLDGLCPGTNEFDTRVSNGSLDRES